MKSDNQAEHQHVDIIVIGGGASGMMAAGTAAKRGKRVLLIEKNRLLGEKLKISGGGRCNITNAEYDARALLKHYGKGEQYLYSAFAQFGVKETFHFFENHGLPLVVQARNRAFPNTERAVDVARVMEKFVKDSGVILLLGKKVTKLMTKDNHITGVVVGTKIYTAKSIILSSGGLSHPETGSTGDGFIFLQSIGHKVISPTPTIVPLAVKESWVKELSGVSLSFMKISFFVEGKKIFSKTGKILFTHFGLSGPLILNCAGKVADLLHSGVVTATIDAYPDSDIGTLEKQILKVFDKHKNKDLKNIIKEIVPKGMDNAILNLIKSQVSGDTKVHSVNKEARRSIINTLKAIPITITGLMGFDRAVVADGGVPLSEIDTKTMRSTKYENLFVIGDLLHINRPSGGYSLQLCWTSGYVAGMHV